MPQPLDSSRSIVHTAPLAMGMARKSRQGDAACQRESRRQYLRLPARSPARAQDCLHHRAMDREGPWCLLIRLHAEGPDMYHLSRLIAAITSIRGEEGQGLAEYSMMLALIAMVAIAGLATLGLDITATLTSIGTTVESVRP
jgi:Flp pilus assembly pilin Flp